MSFVNFSVVKKHISEAGFEFIFGENGLLATDPNKRYNPHIHDSEYLNLPARQLNTEKLKKLELETMGFLSEPAVHSEVASGQEVHSNNADVHSNFGTEDLESNSKGTQVDL